MNQKSCLKLSASLVIAVGILVGGIFPAGASIWTGSSSMSWGDFNNWNPLQVPWLY
ncbi:MAG: hypothetical protein H0X66_22500 [Verrucomicrobia bacterium]|nr:hypothetical protein [Verrucomicrobiota bacterium]